MIVVSVVLLFLLLRLLLEVMDRLLDVSEIIFLLWVYFGYCVHSTNTWIYKIQMTLDHVYMQLLFFFKISSIQIQFFEIISIK